MLLIRRSSDNTGYGHTMHTGIQQRRYIRGCYATNSVNRQRAIHSCQQRLVAFQTQDGAELLLGGGKAEWPQPNVITTLRYPPVQLLQRIGSAAYDLPRPKDAAGYADAFIFEAQVYAVCTGILRHRYGIIDNKVAL